MESLGDALEPLEAHYLTQCRARLLGPVRMRLRPEREGYDADVPTHVPTWKN